MRRSLKKLDRILERVDSITEHVDTNIVRPSSSLAGILAVLREGAEIVREVRNISEEAPEAAKLITEEVAEATHEVGDAAKEVAHEVSPEAREMALKEPVIKAFSSRRRFFKRH